MEMICRKDIPIELLPGRAIQKAVGAASMVSSEKMTVGFAHYSAESGPMQPHNHTEETVVILDAKDGYVRYGDHVDTLDKRIELHPGMILHFPALEWHVFEYVGTGFVDIIFIYGQTDNIRPEQVRS